MQIMRLSAIMVFCVAMLLGCGGDDDGDDKVVGGVQVSWEQANCPEEETLNIVAVLYGSSNEYIGYGGPWQCSKGEGSISGITVGTERTVVLFAENNDGKFILSGKKRGINVQENNIAVTGNIDLYNFVPSLTMPEDGDLVGGEFDLSWGYINRAARYRISISDNADFDNPVITEEINGPPYPADDIPAGATYFWRVASVDIYGNQGADSETWEFTIPVPMTTITYPEDGSEISEYLEITFAGEGVDEFDGVLTETELVWYIDGTESGYGEIYLSDYLSVGYHTITLTASNSFGYSSSDTIVVNILPGD